MSAPSHNFVGPYLRNEGMYRQSEKKLVKQRGVQGRASGNDAGRTIFFSILASKGSDKFAFLWSPYIIGQTIIFLSCDFFLSSSSFLFLA